MEKKKIKYSEGDLFILETENHTKFLGLLARRKGRTKSVIGYFWKLNFEVNDSLILNKKSVVTITRFSSLGFEIGTWQLLGKYKNWKREEWGIPLFCRHDDIHNKYFAVAYNDDFECISDQRITEAEAKNLFDDGTHGYISLENYLQRNFS